MIFLLKNWKKFCKKLLDVGLVSVPLKEWREEAAGKSLMALKHDVETNVQRAYKIAAIEAECGHRGSYYVQAYLLKDEENIKLLQAMQDMGHEVTYHHDVMDSNKGDIGKAITEFEENLKSFQSHGFEVITVCQHGNPVIDRVGYTSNRDFFRSGDVQGRFSGISDIMVDFPDKVKVAYDYYSDAGRKFKLIYDPINNDVINSDEKNVAFEHTDDLLEDALTKQKSFIISIHPHRWETHALGAVTKEFIFKLVKRIVKLLIRIPFLKKIAGRYYYLAKKI